MTLSRYAQTIGNSPSYSIISPLALATAHLLMSSSLPQKGEAEPVSSIAHFCLLTSFALLSTLTTLVAAVDPRSWKEAMGTARQYWWPACKAEMSSLWKAGTYELVPRSSLPPGANVITSKWVFKTKLGAAGELIKHKARIVARGFTQRFGVDYDETYAPVARIASIRILFALAAWWDWEIHQMDVCSAFLNGELDQPVHMEQPDGFVVQGKEDWVCRLKKSLYGLKQAGRTWHRKWTSH